MGYSNSVYKAASDTLHERRLNAEKAAERRKEEVYKKFPRVKELEKQISVGGIKTARAVLAGGDVKDAVSKLRDQNLAMQAEVRKILTDNGYPENYFEFSAQKDLCSYLQVPVRAKQLFLLTE